jgi:hypothetical protein
VRVGLTSPSKQYDALDARARRERVSIQEIIRRALHDQGGMRTDSTE